MSGSKKKADATANQNFAPVDVAGEHDGAVEVFAPADTPFEAPAKTFVPGPYYAAVEEVMPDVAATDSSVAGDVASVSEQSLDLDRRDFLKLFSLSALASAASACVPRPVEKIVPYVDQPVDTVPGVAKNYATTCGECAAGCGVAVKTKDGRPIKLEGSEAHPVSKGALCAIGQASIQGLYHPERLKHPVMSLGGRKHEASWDDIWQRLGDVCKNTAKIGILTRGVTGSARRFYGAFLEKLGSSKDHLYLVDSRSLFSATDKAHSLAFGREGIPRGVLSKAKMILGISSDFLDTGLSPVFHAKNFTQGIGYKLEGGKLGGGKSVKGRFVQFESAMSLTGAKADKRHSIAVGSELPLLVWFLERLVSRKTSELKGTSTDIARAKEVLGVFKPQLKNYKLLFPHLKEEYLDSLVSEMLVQPSVIMSGGAAACSEDATRIQLLALVCNVLLGAYDSILYDSESWMRNPVGAGDFERFLLKGKELDVLFVVDCDPVQSIPSAYGVQDILSSVGTVVSIQSFPRMTDMYAQYLLPMHHYLEAWGDSEPYAGFVSLRQPSVRPISGTYQAEDILLWIAAAAGSPMGFASYRVYLFQEWEKVYKRLGISNIPFSLFIKDSLRKGFVGIPQKRKKASLQSIASNFVAKRYDLSDSDQKKASLLKLVAPIDGKLGDGRHGHLPILQEVGDAMTTVCWDSFAAISPYTCRKLGIKRNDVIRLRSADASHDKYIEVAVFPMPGLAHDAVVVPQGRGIQDKRNTIAHGVGVNPLDILVRGTDPLSGDMVTSAQRVVIEPTGKRYRLAAMQKHNDIANRSDVYKKIGLKKLEKKIAARKGKPRKNLDNVPDLYPSLDKPEIYMHKQDNSPKPGDVKPASIDYRWGMSIDLDRCTGCGACMVACSLENNVPQVGRDQVNLGREMFWIRLDRYFDGPVDEPGVSFQPVMCQQCNHAPCEAVCPVFATTHDPEGINAMTYNRCVGTRYCANACPYKVRRFNWWTHGFGKIGKRLQDRTPRALNPDVTVRTRGVMEKCNFCVGRLRDAKHRLQRISAEENIPKRSLQSNWVKTACEETCPSDAISFGNLKEPGSLVTRLRQDERAYLMLGGDPDHKHYGIKTLPNVSYLAEVVADSPEQAKGGDHHSDGKEGSEHG